jgi:hypothetical protein
MTEPVIFEYDPCKEPVFWYVVFAPTRTNLMPWWLRFFVGDGFQHCYAFRDYKGVTLIVNHLSQGLVADVSPVPATKCVSVLSTDGRETVVLFAGRLKYRYTQRGVQSCVSVVKSLIGLTAWHIWTPQQLFQYLVNHGGVVLCQAANQKSYSPATPSATRSASASRQSLPDASN